VLILPFDENLFNQALHRQNVCTAKFTFLSVFSNKKGNFLSAVESPVFARLKTVIAGGLQSPEIAMEERPSVASLIN